MPKRIVSHRVKLSDASGVHGSLMARMTDALSRMLNDPGTRQAMRSLQAYREARQHNISEEEQRTEEEEHVRMLVQFSI